MSEVSVSIQELLRKMGDASRSILELDLHEEGTLETLALLQEQQIRLREEIGRLRRPGPLDPEEKTLLQEALELELQVNRKLAETRREVSDQLQRIRGSQRVKHAYDHSYSQTDGYFLDRRK
jgi:hypothetical protein